MKYLFPLGLIISIVALIKKKYKIGFSLLGLLIAYYIFVSLILAQGLN